MKTRKSVLAAFALSVLCGAVEVLLASPKRTLTPAELTTSRIGAVEQRMRMYVGARGILPPNLEVLPVHKNFMKETTDGWGRQLRYVAKPDETFIIESLGRDGKEGGVGEDADITHRYKIVRTRDGKSVIERVAPKDGKA